MRTGFYFSQVTCALQMRPLQVFPYMFSRVCWFAWEFDCRRFLLSLYFQGFLSMRSRLLFSTLDLTSGVKWEDHVTSEVSSSEP